MGGRCPHHSLLYKEWVRLGKTHHSTLTPDLRKLNQHMIAPCLPSHLILDLDSTVETVYGRQEGAAVGTNAHKHGRKNYHPLLVFEGQSRLCLNAILLAGNTHASTDVSDFLRQTFVLLGDRPVKYARFDKGFGGEDFYSFWEAKRIGYVGKLKWTQRLQTEVESCRCWKRFVDEDWIIEGITLIYQAISGETRATWWSFAKHRCLRAIKPGCSWIRTGRTKPSSPISTGSRLTFGAFTTNPHFARETVTKTEF